MCPNCKHELGLMDLLPVVSWLMLKGKCRYCQKSISVQYPAVELATALLFVASYLWWPMALHDRQIMLFVAWLAALVGLMALLVYDLRWLLLPNRILYPLSVIAAFMAGVQIALSDNAATALLNVTLAVIIGGGLFYVLFQISKGKWIGGGDVKLGFVLGLIAATPARSVLLIFLAALIGCLVSLPLLALKRLKPSSVIPFGPFLIGAIIIVQLFGHSILHWYQYSVLSIGG